jgi:hypothetical protein
MTSSACASRQEPRSTTSRSSCARPRKQRIFDHLPDVIDAAMRIVHTCECGDETSCYLCLRSYGNQLVHNELNRGAARDLLARFARTA